jgi:hypothetical protein
MWQRAILGLPVPDVPPSVCYPSGRHWQRWGLKPGGQRNLDPRIGRGRASRHGDCQHHGGQGPAVRVGGMVNRRMFENTWRIA